MLDNFFYELHKICRVANFSNPFFLLFNFFFFFFNLLFLASSFLFSLALNIFHPASGTWENLAVSLELIDPLQLNFLTMMRFTPIGF